MPLLVHGQHSQQRVVKGDGLDASPTLGSDEPDVEADLRAEFIAGHTALGCLLVLYFREKIDGDGVHGGKPVACKLKILKMLRISHAATVHVFDWP